MVFSQTNDGQLFSKMFYELLLVTGSVQISEKKSLTDLRSTGSRFCDIPLPLS